MADQILVIENDNEEFIVVNKTEEFKVTRENQAEFLVVVPQGLPGSNGDSAYQVAVKNGFVGTEAQWLLYLQGATGYSAYQVAVNNGFVGTESEWLASLEGDTGPEIELQKTATHIQWRVVGTGSWTNLVALTDLQGAAGDPGENVEFQTSATHIQWRVVGDVSWIDLVALESLRGPQGNEGPSGQAGTYVGINEQTGTSYTPVVSDVGKLVAITNAAAITVTLPTDATAAIPVTKVIDFTCWGTGVITFVNEAGATVKFADTGVMRKTNSIASAIKVAANTWQVAGDLV